MAQEKNANEPPNFVGGQQNSPTIAEETGSNRTEVVRQAWALMKVAHDAKRRGMHIGLASDPTKLDTEIVGLL